LGIMAWGPGRLSVDYGLSKTLGIGRS
jgi:hypothetical protein